MAADDTLNFLFIFQRKISINEDILSLPKITGGSRKNSFSHENQSVLMPLLHCGIGEVQNGKNIGISGALLPEKMC